MNELNKPNEQEKSAILTRHELSSIDLSDVEEIRKIKFTDEQLKAKASSAEEFYNNVLENELKLFIQVQLEFIGKEAVNQDQLQFGRGTLNGICLVKEWFEKQILLRKPEEGEKNTPGEVFPRI